MGRTVFCSRLKREEEGMDFQFYPGEIGKQLFEKVSKAAWVMWQNKQTMLINEKKLNMMDSTHRKFLEDEMLDFLFEGKDIHIDGYTPKKINLLK